LAQRKMRKAPAGSLAGERIPDEAAIFRTPDAIYHRVIQWTTVERKSEGMWFECVTNLNRHVSIVITPVSPMVFRIQMGMRGAHFFRRSPMLVRSSNRPVRYNTKKDSHGIWIETSRVRLWVQQSPWQLRLYRGAQVIWQEQVEDVDWLGNPIVPALGFIMDKKGRSVQHVFESFALSSEEHLYGLGERYARMDQRGQKSVSWNADTKGLTTTDASYKNIPFFMSSRGYAIFIHSSHKIVYELGSYSSITASFCVHAPRLDYFLIAGANYKELLFHYTRLTGRPTVPPPWSFGLWMSRCMYKDIQEVKRVVRGMKRRKIPCDVIHLDPLWLKHRRQWKYDGCDFEWNEQDFGPLESTISWLKKQHMRLCLWENPYVPRGTAMYREGKARGFFPKDSKGRICHLDDPVVRTRMAPVDFSNAKAVAWYQDKHRPLLRAGVSVFKTDYGEAIPGGAIFANGMHGDEMHNLYPLLYNQAVFDVVRSETGAGIVWGRSGYSGSQRCPVVWSGDSHSTWEAMVCNLRSGLSLALSGVAFWSHDIGGFWGKPPSQELYIRWAQFGLLSSHARFHGTSAREPWVFGPRAVEIVRRFARLRYSLLPYLYSYAHVAHLTGVPLMRPMILEFPDDPQCVYLDTQYMLGGELLVAPIFSPDGRRTVYLPQGKWHDFWTYKEYQGPMVLSCKAPLSRIPLFIRGNAIIPQIVPRQRISHARFSNLRLTVFVDQPASFILKDDEEEVTFHAARKKKILIVHGGASHRNYRLVLPGIARPRGLHMEGEAHGVKWDWNPSQLRVTFHAGGRWTLKIRG
jgi:alpha-D-xyloside xylohydrolase